MLVLEDVLLVLVLLPLLLLLLVLVEVVGAVVVVWGVVLTALAVLLEVVVVLEEEEVVVLTRVPVVFAVAAGASGSLSIVPSALLTFDPRLFCMALLCLKTAKKEHIREKKTKQKRAITETIKQINSSTIKHF